MNDIIDSHDLENKVGDKRASYNMSLERLPNTESYWFFAHSGKIGAKLVKHTIIAGKTSDHTRREYYKRLAIQLKNGYECVRGVVPAHLLKPGEKGARRLERLQVPSLKEITAEDLGARLARQDTDFAIAEKKDGYFRFLIVDEAGDPFCQNHTAELRSFIGAVTTAARKLIPPDSILNVEVMMHTDKSAFIHDVQRWGGKDVRDLPRRERHALLKDIPTTGAPLCVVPFTSTKDAVEEIRRLEQAGREGIVLVNLNATYGANRDFKFKFLKTASVVIMREIPKPDTGRFTYEVGVYNRKGDLIKITTAAPTRGQRFKDGEVIEIRYRKFAGKEDSQLQECYVIPEFSPREDKLPKDCTWEKLVPCGY